MIGRITQIMEREGLTPSKFAEAIGIQRSAMSHILNGRNNVSLDVLIKILDRFTYVDSDWLLFGKGEMVRDHMSTQPDLFSNTAINPSGGQAALEYRKEMRVNTPVNTVKPTVVEQIIQQETATRKVSKIMVLIHLTLLFLKKIRKNSLFWFIYHIHVSLYRIRLIILYEEVHA